MSPLYRVSPIGSRLGGNDEPHFRAVAEAGRLATLCTAGPGLRFGWVPPARGMRLLTKDAWFTWVAVVPGCPAPGGSLIPAWATSSYHVIDFWHHSSP